MSGGKGGSTSTELPGYLQDFQKANMRRAEELSTLGYSPYTGPEVAAVNPWEEIAGVNQAQMSGAFNMGAPSTSIASRMPETVTAPDGSEGYSSFPIFNQAVAELANVAPEFDQRYKSQLNLPSYGDPYEAGSAAAALRDIGGVGPEKEGFDKNKLIQMGGLLASMGNQQSMGQSALQALAGMSAGGLLGKL